MLPLPFEVIPSPYTQEEIQKLPLSVRVGLSRLPGNSATPAFIAQEAYNLENGLLPPVTRMVGRVYMTPEEYLLLGPNPELYAPPPAEVETEPLIENVVSKPRGRPPLSFKDKARKDAAREAYDQYLLRCAERKAAMSEMDGRERELNVAIRDMRKRHAEELADIQERLYLMKRKNREQLALLTSAMEEASDYHKSISQVL